jgi:hypothetical protein
MKQKKVKTVSHPVPADPTKQVLNAVPIPVLEVDPVTDNLRTMIETEIKTLDLKLTEYDQLRNRRERLQMTLKTLTGTVTPGGNGKPKQKRTFLPGVMDLKTKKQQRTRASHKGDTAEVARLNAEITELEKTVAAEKAKAAAGIQ